MSHHAAHIDFEVLHETAELLQPAFRAMFQGQSLWFPNQKQVIKRNSGADEEAFFTYSCSPIISPVDGRCYGIFAPVIYPSFFRLVLYFLIIFKQSKDHGDD